MSGREIVGAIAGQHFNERQDNAEIQVYALLMLHALLCQSHALLMLREHRVGPVLHLVMKCFVGAISRRNEVVAGGRLALREMANSVLQAFEVAQRARSAVWPPR